MMNLTDVCVCVRARVRADVRAQVRVCRHAHGGKWPHVFMNQESRSSFEEGSSYWMKPESSCSVFSESEPIGS